MRSESPSSAGERADQYRAEGQQERGQTAGYLFSWLVLRFTLHDDLIFLQNLGKEKRIVMEGAVECEKEADNNYDQHQNS